MQGLHRQGLRLRDKGGAMPDRTGRRCYDDLRKLHSFPASPATTEGNALPVTLARSISVTGRTATFWRSVGARRRCSLPLGLGYQLSTTRPSSVILSGSDLDFLRARTCDLDAFPSESSATDRQSCQPQTRRRARWAGFSPAIRRRPASRVCARSCSTVSFMVWRYHVRVPPRSYPTKALRKFEIAFVLSWGLRRPSP